MSANPWKSCRPGNSASDAVFKLYMIYLIHLCVRMNEDYLHSVISLAADVHFRCTCISATRTNKVSYMCTFADWLCKSAMESNQLLFILVRFDSYPAHTRVSLETLLESYCVLVLGIWRLC